MSKSSAQPSQLTATCHDLVVDEQHEGVRLDAYLAEVLPNLTRSQAKRLIESGQVTLNDREVKASFAVRVHDRVQVNIPPPVEATAKPEDIPLDVIYEDHDIIVVNKPAGLVVHPAAGHPTGTLVNALMAHCSDLSGIGGELKAGIVHRLDVGTSGVIIAAKNDDAHVKLTTQFQERSVDKIYAALVLGSFKADHGTYDAPIGRSRSDRKRISQHTSKARHALTEWRVLERFGTMLTWMEVTLHTGRTHQIRVHFSEAGHPLVGDPLYGGERKHVRIPTGGLREAIDSLSRPALHAWKLAVTHPRTGERMHFEAPIAEDLERVLLLLRQEMNEISGKGNRA